jgi:hypothetical protein
MKARRAFCLYVLTAVAWSASIGQAKRFNICAAHVHASPSAQTFVDQILRELVQLPDTILVFASFDQDVADQSGAVSGECPMSNGLQRWIVYDPDVIPADVPLEFALAHETAHHMNRHVLNGESHSKEQELEADGYAARYLTMFGWDDQRLLAALDGLKLQQTTSPEYPSLDERKAAAMAGYRAMADIISDQDKAAIQTVLNRYADIITKRKAKNLREIWPTVTAGTINIAQSFIDNSRNITLSIVPEKWEHHGTGILVTCRQAQSFERNGTMTNKESVINFYMVKSQGIWIISDIPESSN